jgi:mono/diheme cytochrome c family protein
VSEPVQRDSARRARLVAAAVVGALLAGATGANAVAATEDGKAVFEQLCQGCHTIGGGKTTGPDLQGLADRREEAWVKRFILEPDKVIASGDPIANELLDEYGSPMPNLGVTEAQIGPLLSYLGFAEQSGTETTPTETTPTETTPTETTPTETTPTETVPAPTPTSGDAARGEELFTGSERFDAGGPSCLSCHSVAGVGALGGGQLGPDLTGSFAKYGGEQGLNAALKTIPFPTMLPIFSRKALTDDERADLVAFLAGAPDQQRPASAAGKLVGFSVAAVALMALLGIVIWRHRLTGVRKPLVNRSRRK